MSVTLDKPKADGKIVVATRVPALPTGSITPRMPTTPKVYGRGPFQTLGDVVAECGVEGCGYGISGPRAIVGVRLREHHRLFHSEQTGVVLLNTPRQ